MSKITENWHAIKVEVKTFLVQLARSEKTIAYSELAAQVRTAYIHYRAPAFGAMLREIAADDDAQGRPALATLVVNKATGRPGKGYFTHMGTEGDDISDPEAYWQKRFRAVCDYWQNHEDE